MKDGYVVGLQNDTNIIMQRNASIGASHAALVPYVLSKYDFSDCDVAVLDISINEQYATWLYEYDISLSSQIFDYFLSICTASKVLPIVLLIPEIIGYSFPQNPKFQQMRRHYIDLCNKRNIPYFDGYAYIENMYSKAQFTNFFKDRDIYHIASKYAQELGSALAKSITTIYSSHKIINEDIDVYDFKFINMTDGILENKNIIEHKTSLIESKLLKLSENETCDVYIGEYEIVGVAFNAAQTNGIVEFKGEELSYKMLSNSFFDPNRSLLLVVWSLLKPIKPDIDGKITLKCLKQADIPNMELNEHGKINMEKYGNEPARIEIEGFIVRSKEMRKTVGMRVDINLDMERY
jgi:hypothetical protein